MPQITVNPVTYFSDALKLVIGLLTVCLAGQCFGQENPATTAEVKEQSSTPLTDKTLLFTKDFPGETWSFFSGKKGTTFGETWSYVDDPESKIPYVVCTGQPYGYIRTKKQFRNFEFGLEWRFPKDNNGNSGVLIYTTGDNRIWPTSLQVQLQQPFAGSVFPSGGAKSSNELRDIPMLSRPINQWNRCIISSINGTVTVSVNDESVGVVQNCNPHEGSISLQSEGSEIHFRNVWIRELPATDESLSNALPTRTRRLKAILKQNRRSMGVNLESDSIR